MAKRIVKPPKEAVTLGWVMRDLSPDQLRFTISSKLARLTPENELERGYAMFDRHLAAGNIVEGKSIGMFPKIPTYRVANPDAPALI